jgi:hypothetical protein
MQSNGSTMPTWIASEIKELVWGLAVGFLYIIVRNGVSVKIGGTLGCLLFNNKLIAHGNGGYGSLSQNENWSEVGWWGRIFTLSVDNRKGGWFYLGWLDFDGGRRSGRLRNGWKGGLSRGSNRFYTTEVVLVSVFGIVIDGSIESLLLSSIADYGVIAIVGSFSTGFLMCGRWRNNEL